MSCGGNGASSQVSGLDYTNISVTVESFNPVWLALEKEQLCPIDYLIYTQQNI